MAKADRFELLLLEDPFEDLPIANIPPPDAVDEEVENSPSEAFSLSDGAPVESAH